MLEGIRAAHALGFETGIVTNCYWATSDEDARAALRPLIEAGLGSISLSSDLFHGSDMITPEYRAASAASAALGLSESVIIVEPPEGSSYLTPKGEPVRGGRVMFRGRAAARLARDAPHVPAETLRECPHENLDDPSRVHIDPFGNVHVCQGLVMGNLLRMRLKDVIAGYRPEADPVFGPLTRGGPYELAVVHGLPLEEGYADACHLCYETRKALRSRYRYTLTPDQMFGVGME
jgi:hypothetical protein